MTSQLTHGFWPYPKTQTVRLADVFVIGPLMVYGGYKLAAENKAAGWALALLGLTTIHFNGVNYLRAREGEQS